MSQLFYVHVDATDFADKAYKGWLKTDQCGSGGRLVASTKRATQFAGRTCSLEAGREYLRRNGLQGRLTPSPVGQTPQEGGSPPGASPGPKARRICGRCGTKSRWYRTEDQGPHIRVILRCANPFVCRKCGNETNYTWEYQGEEGNQP
jgi:DNA-directed RNA polymerase subunit M/transcription elongation factor TFIIS